jgi:uncharacterized protein with ParB-like and HNH nuclease domain
MENGIHKIENFLGSDILFNIPKYQRSYAWEKSQLSDFFDDIYYIEKSKDYFLGTILLEFSHFENIKLKRLERKFEVYDVIDGQQRLTTIFIFIKSAIDIIQKKLDAISDMEEKSEIEERIKEWNKKILPAKEIVRLSLFGEDKEFFKNYVVKNQVPTTPLTPSQRRLKFAKDYFDKRFDNLDYIGLLDLVEKLLNSKIVLYSVKNTGDAMLMFETINDRGKPLSNLEKTKSFLMYLTYISSEEKVDNKEIEEFLSGINYKFGEIYKYIENINQIYKDIKEDDIQRYHWAIAYEKEYKKVYKYMEDLKIYFRNFILDENKKSQIENEVEKYVKTLKDSFLAFEEIFVKRISDFSKLQNIILLGRVANFYPLLIASWLKRKNDEEFKGLLDYIEKFVFRVFLIGNKRSDAGINALYKLAFEVFNNKKSVLEAKEEIKKLTLFYVGNDELRRKLKSINFYNEHSSKDIKYIFYNYEVYLRKKVKENIELSIKDVLGKNYSIEHILAQNLKEEDRPEELKDEEAFKEYVNKLGNLVLCSSSWNSSMGNKPFKYKSRCENDNDKCYENSLLRCQKELAKYDKFSKNEIEERENKLINWIMDEWSF